MGGEEEQGLQREQAQDVPRRPEGEGLGGQPQEEEEHGSQVLGGEEEGEGYA